MLVLRKSPVLLQLYFLRHLNKLELGHLILAERQYLIPSFVLLWLFQLFLNCLVSLVHYIDLRRWYGYLYHVWEIGWILSSICKIASEAKRFHCYSKIWQCWFRFWNSDRCLDTWFLDSVWLIISKSFLMIKWQQRDLNPQPHLTVCHLSNSE